MFRYQSDLSVASSDCHFELPELLFGFTVPPGPVPRDVLVSSRIALKCITAKTAGCFPSGDDVTDRSRLMNSAKIGESLTRQRQCAS